jgi:hypothetical protein
MKVGGGKRRRCEAGTNLRGERAALGVAQGVEGGGGEMEAFAFEAQGVLVLLGGGGEV